MLFHKLEHSDAFDFIFAGNSLFTVLNTKTQNRFTFKVKNNKKNSEQENLHFVKVLTNPEIYEFIGTCFNKQYRHSKKSRISNEAQSVKVFNYIITALSKKTLPEFIEIWHEGRCGKCGRVLTVPASISIGIGPECIKSLNNKQIKRSQKLSKLLAD